MNPATGIALAVAAVFAAGDWISKVRDDRRLEYVCKPATLAALVVAAIALDPAAGADARRAWFVVALVLSLAGDVFLMFDGERELFVPGLASFLLAHVAYIVGFWTDGPALWAFAVAAVVVAAVLGPVAARIIAALRRTEPELRGPVTGYIVVISVMVATALATGNVVAGVGAALFAWSDSMIAWNRFVRPFAGAGLAIMVTYHLGQAALVLSLLR